MFRFSTCLIMWGCLCHVTFEQLKLKQVRKEIRILIFFFYPRVEKKKEICYIFWKDFRVKHRTYLNYLSSTVLITRRKKILAFWLEHSSHSAVHLTFDWNAQYYHSCLLITPPHQPVSDSLIRPCKLIFLTKCTQLFKKNISD